MPDKKQIQRVLAFDFGAQKIGVAFGQSLSASASPLTPLKSRDGVPDWHQIEKLIEQWQPDLFVVGIPYNMDGSDNEITVRARKFMRRLHGRFGKPSHGMDERLSSRAARELLEQKGDNRTSLDSMAATLILESWFNRQTPSSLKGEHSL